MNESVPQPRRHLEGHSDLSVVSNVPARDGAYIADAAPTAMDHRQLVTMIQSIKGTHGAVRLTMLDAPDVTLDLCDVLDLTIEPGSPEILITTAHRRLLVPVTNVAAAEVVNAGDQAGSATQDGPNATPPAKADGDCPCP